VPNRSWTIKTKQVGDKTRAQCPLCSAHRDHAERNTAVKFVTGHLVAKHHADGVRVGDSFIAD